MDDRALEDMRELLLRLELKAEELLSPEELLSCVMVPILKIIASPRLLWDRNSILERTPLCQIAGGLVPELKALSAPV